MRGRKFPIGKMIRAMERASRIEKRERERQERQQIKEYKRDQIMTFREQQLSYIE